MVGGDERVLQELKEFRERSNMAKTRKNMVGDGQEARKSSQKAKEGQRRFE